MKPTELKTYTQEQVDIEILKNNEVGIAKTLEHLERRLESNENRLIALDATVKTQFSNFTNYILGIYGLILASLLAKVMHFI